MMHTTARASRAAAAGWSVARPHLAIDGAPRRIYLEKVDRTMQSAGGMLASAGDAARWLELMIADARSPVAGSCRRPVRRYWQVPVPGSASSSRPQRVNYHLAHHLLMTVPCDNLPRLHDLLAQRGLLGACIANRYREVLAAMVSAPGEPR